LKLFHEALAKLDYYYQTLFSV